MICQIEGAVSITPSCASMNRAGIVKTAPATTCELFAPTDWVITFSSIELRRLAICE